MKRNNSKARPIIAQEAGGAPPSLTRQENHTSKRKRVVNFCAVITSLESVGWTGREMRGAWGVGGGGGAKYVGRAGRVWSNQQGQRLRGQVRKMSRSHLGLSLKVKRRLGWGLYLDRVLSAKCFC